jgi:hypothetical protein
MRYVNDSMIVDYLSIPPPSSLGQLVASPSDVTSPEIGHRPGRAKRPKESHHRDRKLVCIVPCILSAFSLERSDRNGGQGMIEIVPALPVV